MSPSHLRKTTSRQLPEETTLTNLRRENVSLGTGLAPLGQTSKCSWTPRQHWEAAMPVAMT